MSTAVMKPCVLRMSASCSDMTLSGIENELLIGLVLGWITLTLALFLINIVRRWGRVRRYGDPINHGLLLVEYGRKLTEVNDQQALGKLLIEDLPSELGIQRAALLLPEEYQLVSVIDDDFHIPISHAAVRWVASSGEAQKASMGQLLKHIQQGRTDLSWTEVWVPLMRGTRLRGMWMLGRRSDQRQYSPETLRCLTSVAREAAAVLEAMTYAEQERQSAREMRALYRQVVKARESERDRLARELHDGVLQDLCAVTRDLKAMDSLSEFDEAASAPLVIRSSETVNALRAICNGLRPPLLQQDLISALNGLIRELDSRSKAPVHLDTQVDKLQLNDEVALAIFRITQEALNNAIQHADASEIAVRLTQYPDRLRLTVTDDGQGISGNLESARFVARGHFGLAGMRERSAMVGGKLDVQSAVDYGTVVILELPL